MIHGAEGDARADTLLANGLMMEAKILVEKGERVRADEVGKQSVDLLDILVARDPADMGNPNSLAQILSVHAGMATSPETGRTCARRSNEIYKTLLRETRRARGAAGWTTEIAANLHNEGHHYFAESTSASGEKKLDVLQSAIDALSERRRFCAEQAGQIGEPDRMLFALAVNERYLCRAYRAKASLLGDQHQRSEAFEKGIACGKEAIADFQTLTVHDSSHYKHSLELHGAQRELDLAFFNLERWDSAILFYKKARETLKLMALRHGNLVSRMVWFQESIAIEDYNLLNVLAPDDAANEKLIRELVDEAYVICDKLDVVPPLSPKLRQVYAYVSYCKAGALEESTGILAVDLNQKAARLYAEVLGENPADIVTRCYVVVALLELADALAARGQSDESRRTENDALAVAKSHRNRSRARSSAYSSDVVWNVVLRSPGDTPAKSPYIHMYLQVHDLDELVVFRLFQRQF
jgi:tetratricopeptide (TPR) repeat protein